MKQSLIILALCVAGGLHPSFSAMAQDKETVNEQKLDAEALNGEESGTVEAVALARQLAHYGRENESALAVVAAADILTRTGARVEMPEMDVEGEGEPRGETEEDMPAVPLEPQALLDLAQQLAAGDEAVEALIAEVEDRLDSDTRGGDPGPYSWTDVVDGGFRNGYNLNFRGGEPAVIAVRGVRGADLDCYIYDENGNLITHDERYVDDCDLVWRPRWSGPFRLVVTNRTGYWNRFYAASN